MAKFTERYRVPPGARVDLGKFKTGDRAAFGAGMAAGHKRLHKLQSRLEDLQEALYAEGQQRLLVVLQGMDAAGKDGVIRSVFEGVNPQGVRVQCFKQPTAAELRHDFMWRVHPHVPGNGEIAIFNRSHYEDVVAVRVHGLVTKKVWRARYAHIADFERLLVDEGTVVRKFFLHVSKDEQRKRLQERIDDPKKRWKFNQADLLERRRWDDYQQSYAEAIAATSTTAAPWYVVPADHNWYRDMVVAEVLVATLEAMRIRLPADDPELHDQRVS